MYIACSYSCWHLWEVLATFSCLPWPTQRSIHPNVRGYPRPSLGSTHTHTHPHTHTHTHTVPVLLLLGDLHASWLWQTWLEMSHIFCPMTGPELYAAPMHYSIPWHRSSWQRDCSPSLFRNVHACIVSSFQAFRHTLLWGLKTHYYEALGQTTMRF